MMIALTVILLVLAEIIYGSIMLVRNVRQMKEQRNRKFCLLIAGVFAIGSILAIGSFFAVYPYGENMRIVGLPIPAAAFQQRNGVWRDFVGPTTLPVMCANAWFGFVLPHLAFRAIRWRKTR
jgi:hypothetical protein